MLRIVAVYALIAASVFAYIVVSREGVVKLKHAAIEEGVTPRTRSRYSHQRNGSPQMYSQRRRMSGRIEEEKRLVSAILRYESFHSCISVTNSVCSFAQLEY